MLTLIHAMKMNHKGEKGKARHASIRNNIFLFKIFLMQLMTLKNRINCNDRNIIFIDSALYYDFEISIGYNYLKEER